MSKKNQSENEEYSLKRAVAFSFGQFGDIIAYQFFTFLIFTFYYSIQQLNVNWITIAFIFWAVWNGLNDPLLGIISDRTSTKWGKRRPYVIASFIPFAIIIILVWTPPDDAVLAFVYFIIIIMLFDTIYTMFSINATSSFPVMFPDLESRAKANIVRQIFSVLGLIVAFILPSFFIQDYTKPEYEQGYVITGIIIAITFTISAIIFILFGLKEREEFIVEAKSGPRFFESIKHTLKNKAFQSYTIGALANWYVFGMLPTIVPLYGKFVLDVPEGLLLSLLLGVAFISAAFFNFLWRYITLKIGLRKGFMLSMGCFIAGLVPFMFLSPQIGGYAGALVSFFFLGAGLAGSLYFRDPIVSTIADYDELKTGVRREGGFYGVNALVIRLSTIFIFITISLVFTSTGWAVFEPETVTPEIIVGLRLLMFFFPAIALVIGILSISRFPIRQEEYQEIKDKVDKLHQEKRDKLKNR
ncbi:MAG: MFS transporter [Candidatus Lokiarchaeota archaeon]|nr:MFS transporter [Candidatus Lokiarchaeota archaeon]MBD3202123.1 MFS transporter [Candidatus Lokiarchaeota archaeon]